MIVMRWWTELRNPALKCARTAHRMWQCRITGFARPGMKGLSYHYRAVVVEFTALANMCRRCRDLDESSVQIEHEEGFTGLTMDSARHRQLHRKGVLISEVQWLQRVVK